MNLIKQNKVIFFTLVISIIISLLDSILPFILVKNYLDNMQVFNDLLLSIDIILAIIGFSIVGLYIVIKSTVKEVLSATIIFMLYISLAFILEYIVQRIIGYKLLLLLLFFPIRLFTVFPQLILWKTETFNALLLHVILSVLFPSIYLGIIGIKTIINQSFRNNFR